MNPRKETSKKGIVNQRSQKKATYLSQAFVGRESFQFIHRVVAHVRLMSEGCPPALISLGILRGELTRRRNSFYCPVRVIFKSIKLLTAFSLVAEPSFPSRYVNSPI